jgi:hypothetical protein
MNIRGLLVALNLFFAVLMIGGCGLIREKNSAFRNLRDRNRENIAKNLSVGMSEDKVRSLLGGRVETSEIFGPRIMCSNPQKTETRKINGESYLILWYYTDLKHNDGTFLSDELTPIVLKDGHVVGWGSTFLCDLKEDKKT